MGHLARVPARGGLPGYASRHADRRRPMPPPTRHVLLIHGIWNARFWLSPLAAKLRAAGLAPRNWGYASVFGGPAQAVPRLVEALRDGPPTSLVGHSLGGLVALEALRQAPDLPVPRVVCMGTPLRGSRTAAWLADRSADGLLLGRSSQLLRAGCRAWDGAAQVGVVAGNVPHGLGRLVRAFDDASDGTVRIAETRIPGLADHCVVPTSHSGLVLSPLAARQVAAFLLRGRFER